MEWDDGGGGHQKAMSVNRRSFLRALIGAPFAAKALEAIIAKSVAAPVVAPVPVAATPEPKWEKPSLAHIPACYPTTGFAYSATPYNFSGVCVPDYHPFVTVPFDVASPVIINDLVEVDAYGRVVPHIEGSSRHLLGRVIGTELDREVHGGVRARATVWIYLK